MKVINYKINVKAKKDKKSNCWIIYSKKIDVTGYGRTKKEARDMFIFTLEAILTHKKN